MSPGRLSDLAQIWGLLLQWGLLQVPQRVFTFQRFLSQESQVCSGILGNPGSIRTAISNSNNVLGKKSVTLIHWIVVVVEVQCFLPESLSGSDFQQVGKAILIQQAGKSL